MARYGYPGCFLLFLFTFFFIVLLPVWAYSVAWGYFPIGLLLLIFLIVALPTWPYSRTWGYYPSGGLGFLLFLLLLLLLIGIL
jgi:hypothetical protein